jgi:hypothetical protein
MSVLAHLDRWQRAGTITTAQHETLTALTRRDRISIFLELNALLYLGVVAVVGGVGWTVSRYAARLGDVAIVSTLTAAFIAALGYCFARALRFSRNVVEQPGLTFDYVLYLGCLVFAVDLGYIQSQFHPFGNAWDHSLLLAALTFFALAYRFDNRFVLSLALSSLAGWFGIKVSSFALQSPTTLRLYALGYGALVASAGAGSYRLRIKPHFLEAYLHVAAQALFIALVSGVASNGGESIVYLAAALALGALAIVEGVRLRRFAFVVYGVVYGYAGITTRVLWNVNSFELGLAYYVVSGSAVVVALVVLARRFGRDT